MRSILFLLLATSLLAAAIACGAPDPATAQAGSQIRGGDRAADTDANDDDGPPKKAKGVTTAMPPPVSTAPGARVTGRLDGGTSSSSSQDPVVECFLGCIGKDAKARTIFQNDESCRAGCDPNDESCNDDCLDKVNRACQQSSASCDKLDQCSEECGA